MAEELGVDPAGSPSLWEACLDVCGSEDAIIVKGAEPASVGLRTSTCFRPSASMQPVLRSLRTRHQCWRWAESPQRWPGRTMTGSKTRRNFCGALPFLAWPQLPRAHIEAVTVEWVTVLGAGVGAVHCLVCANWCRRQAPAKGEVNITYEVVPSRSPSEHPCHPLCAVQP